MRLGSTGQTCVNAALCRRAQLLWLRRPATRASATDAWPWNKDHRGAWRPLDASLCCTVVSLPCLSRVLSCRAVAGCSALARTARFASRSTWRLENVSRRPRPNPWALTQGSRRRSQPSQPRAVLGSQAVAARLPPTDANVLLFIPHRPPCADVAVKITPTSVVRSACKEVTALTRLNNTHIVQLLGVQVDMAAEKVYMVMELCHGGELFDRIAECGGLAESEARRYFVQMLHALCHCHENGVYHRDLKPENILLDADDNAKVADFGLAALYRSHVTGGAGFLQHTKVGSVMYAAPEVLISTAASGYDAACADIWSLGVILFSMLSGTLPFTCAAASKCKRYVDAAPRAREGWLAVANPLLHRPIRAPSRDTLSRARHPPPPGAGSFGLPALLA